MQYRQTTVGRPKICVRQATFAIALVLILAVSTFMATVPAAEAHTPPWTIPTWCYINITPSNSISVNEDALIVFWLNAVPPTAAGTYGDRWTLYLDVTKPDGNKETIGPVTSDPVGSCYRLYKATQPGVYTFVARFDGQKITGIPTNPNLPPERQTGAAYVNDTYAASKSDPITLTVSATAGQTKSWKDTPLPTSYWTLPINSMNRNWYVLAGNWLGGAAQNVGPTTNFGYGTGPESAHILWTAPMWAGGIMDARFGDIGYQTAHYEGISFVPPIILNGHIYYNTQSLPREGWYCVDLYTGETEYFYNTTGSVTGVSGSSSGSIPGESLAWGQILNVDNPNQHGGMPYLWSTSDPKYPSTWRMYDAYTSNYICSINNVPSWTSGGMMFGPSLSTAIYGKDGSILRYYLANLGNASAPKYYLQVWNTTQAIWWKNNWTSNEYWMWRPGLNVTYDGRNGYSLNVTIPDMTGATIRAVREDKYVIVGTSGKNNGTYIQQGWLAALNLDPKGTMGQMLWNISFTPPQSIPDIGIGGAFSAGAMQGPTVDPEDGVFVFNEAIGRQRWGYSLTTGQKLWGPTPSEPAYNYYGMGSNIYDGKLYGYGYGGSVVAYNITTGKVLWIYNATGIGWESPYGNYPIGIACVADGKLYLASSEHSPTQPLWRGSYLRCVDADTGTELWKLSLWGAKMSPTESDVFIADGYLVGLNYYDNQLYCMGKGPSQTTVSAPQSGVSIGKPIMITGTVTDQSPGAKGAAAVSDQDQQSWMEYIYEQQAMPTSVTGVPVQVVAIGPNNQTTDIGTVNSDSGGSFGIMWTPPAEGKYQIVATFAGSKSYGNSFATAYIGVGPAEKSNPAVITPPPTQTSTPTQTPAKTTSPSLPPSPSPSPSTAPNPTSETGASAYLIAAIAVVIIVIVVAIALLLNRRSKHS